jgi:hypothetical protein
MPRFHTRGVLDENGKQIGQENVSFTAQEEADHDVEAAAIAAAQPLLDWKAGMVLSDKDIPRSTEDIYDALDEDAQGRVVQITRDRITAKKTLRG